MREGNRYIFEASIPREAELPWVAADDLGPIAAAIFENSKAYVGARLQVAGEVATMDQFVDVFRKTLNVDAVYNFIPAVQQTNLDARQELVMSFYMLLAHSKPYVDLKMLRALYPELKDISAWLSGSKFSRINQ